MRPVSKHKPPFFSRDGVITTIILTALAALFAVVIIGPIYYKNQTKFIAAEVEVAQLREDLARLSGQSTIEDVIGQATAYNMLIKRKQAFNKLWWCGWLIPNGWDDLELLEVGSP